MPTIVSMTILMLIVVWMARRSDKKARAYTRPYGVVKYENRYTILIILTLSFYAALRTTGNDTSGYIKHFLHDTKYSGVFDFFASGGWFKSKGAIFELLQLLCKHHISDNYHIFFFISALITNGLIITFLRRYSPSFLISVFLYLAMDGYGVSLTGMRQALATAVVLWTIPAFASKKRIRYILLLYLAYKIHFIAILFLVIPFMNKTIWNKRVVFFIILALASIWYYDKMAVWMLDTTELLGYSYGTAAVFGKGVNILRVLVYLVPGAMAFVYKKGLNELGEIEKICINSSIVGGALTGVGINGNSNTFGRFGLLFEPCIYISLPAIIGSVTKFEDRKAMYIVMVSCFLVYYLFGFLKIGVFENYYGLVSLTELFLT